MLEQQQLVADPSVGARGRESLLEVPRVAVGHPAQPPCSDRPILHGWHDSRRPTRLPRARLAGGRGMRDPGAAGRRVAPCFADGRRGQRSHAGTGPVRVPAPVHPAAHRAGDAAQPHRLVGARHGDGGRRPRDGPPRRVPGGARARRRRPDRRPGRGRPPDRALHLARADGRRRPVHPGVRAAGRGRPRQRHGDLRPAVPRRPRDHGHRGRDARRRPRADAPSPPSAST